MSAKAAVHANACLTTLLSEQAAAAAAAGGASVLSGALDLKELRRRAVEEALLDPLRHSQDSPLGLRLSQEDGNVSSGSSSTRAAHDGMCCAQAVHASDCTVPRAGISCVLCL